MEHKIINHGFIAPRITDDQYVLGASSVPRIILQPDRDWRPFVPTNEWQINEGFDTSGCTTFNTLNAVEMITRRVFGEQVNYSDRFPYITSNTRPPGNDPHNVCEAIRNFGMVLEEFLPFSKDIITLEQFIEIMDQAIYEKGRDWKKHFDFMHEWVFKTYMPLATKQKLILEALQYSPVGVSVLAWKQRENGLYYKEIGEQDSHWFTITHGEEGKPWTGFDSYPDAVGLPEKKLEWDYDFGFAKRYHLRERTPEEMIAFDQPKRMTFCEWFNKLIKR